MTGFKETTIFEKALDCVRCGSCRVIYADRIKSMRFGKQCPAGTYHLIESFYPAGLMYLAVGLMRNQFPYSSRALEAVYSCTLCGYCQDICEEYVETQTLTVIEALRNKAVREGVGPLPAQRIAIKKLTLTDNILGQARASRLAWTKKLKGEVKNVSRGDRTSLLYFLGCQYSLNPALQDIVLSTASLLNEAGIQWGTLGEGEKCCGYLAAALGYQELYEKYAGDMITAINQLGVNQVVTSCPQCYYTLKVRYPEIAPLSFEVIHITELLTHLLAKGNLKLRTHKEKLTYHDPCYLGRYCHLYEPPRQIIMMLPGRELREMERNRRDAWCCGGGGGVMWGNKSYALATAVERLNEALSSGAETLVTSCPTCYLLFDEAQKESSIPIAIKDITTLLSQVLPTK